MQPAKKPQGDAKAMPQPQACEIKMIRRFLLEQINEHHCTLVFKEAKSEAELPDNPQPKELLSWFSSKPVIFNAGGFSVILNKMKPFLSGDEERLPLRAHLKNIFEFTTFTQVYNYIMDSQSAFHQKAPICASDLADIVKKWDKSEMLSYVLFDQNNRAQNGLTQAAVGAAIERLTPKPSAPSASASSASAKEKDKFSKQPAGIPLTNYGSLQ